MEAKQQTISEWADKLQEYLKNNYDKNNNEGLYEYMRVHPCPEDTCNGTQN